MEFVWVLNATVAVAGKAGSARLPAIVRRTVQVTAPAPMAYVFAARFGWEIPALCLFATSALATAPANAVHASAKPAGAEQNVPAQPNWTRHMFLPTRLHPVCVRCRTIILCPQSCALVTDSALTTNASAMRNGRAKIVAARRGWPRPTTVPLNVSSVV